MSLKKIFIKKLVLLAGLSVLLVGCSTTRYGDRNLQASGPADLGERYLLGRAAEDDDPLAQNELAYLYAAGKGTKQDYNKAFHWYQQAAEHGLASAQYNLGIMYLHGLGTPANPALAKQWFKKSASLGFEPAKQAIAN
jgi:uncharacterized protein